MKRYLPPAIKEIIAPAEFVQDETLQDKIIDDHLTHDYAVILLICSILLIIVVLL